MRLVFLIASICGAFETLSQGFVFPQLTNVYSDTFAIQVYAPVATEHYKQRLEISTAFGDYRFEKIVDDSIVVVPYYTLYDNQRVIVGQLEGTSRFARIYRGSVRLMPIAKSDSLEQKLYRTMETVNEKNLLSLARGYEELDCYGNALYVYYKLSKLGYRKHLLEFIARNKVRWVNSTSSVHR